MARSLDRKDKECKDIEASIVEVEVARDQSFSTRAKAFATRTRLFVLQRGSESPWPKLVRRSLYLLSSIFLFGILAYIIQHAFLLALIHKFRPLPQAQNGLTTIVSDWREPGSVTPAPPSWLPEFSRDVEPKAIHSHNDYWRQVPLFDALSLGITGVEADCHLVNGELYVAHKANQLNENRTLRSLYVDPLITILTNQNTPNNLSTITGTNGLWDVNTTQGIVLMTDLKTEGYSTLAAVQAQLEPLRENGWLTYWNGTALIPGPITHVGTGNTPFDAVLNSSYSNSTYRDVFFDAPLNDLSSIYNASNSWYASTSITQLFSKSQRHIPNTGLTRNQLEVVKAQIDQAGLLGLVSRYWDIPAWPVERRNRIWEQLEDLGIGMLNVDAIDEAARWNWRLCNVLGLRLC